MQSDNSTALPMGGADSTFGTSNHPSSMATRGGLFRKPTRREIHETHKRNMAAFLLNVMTLIFLTVNMNLDGLGHFHNRPVPVDKFPFLKSVLDGADLVGLYFAASWCPMSTPVTSMLSGDMMPEAIGAAINPSETVGAKSGKSLIDIVYVSSDETEEQMDGYIDSEWTNWKSVPFDSDERTELKR